MYTLLDKEYWIGYWVLRSEASIVEKNGKVDYTVWEY